MTTVSVCVVKKEPFNLNLIRPYLTGVVSIKLKYQIVA